MQKIDKTSTLKEILNNNHFAVDYFQREYRWGRKQIEQMLSDFQGTFEKYYDPDKHDSLLKVSEYGYYYMGCIICSKGSAYTIIDGQQRLTSLTLLLIYLDDLQKKCKVPEEKAANLTGMIYSTHYGEKSFNLDIPERAKCMKALLEGNNDYNPKNESERNMLERFKDIEELFPDELKGDALPFFIYWLIEKVTLLQIETPSEDEAHTIFLTMNDRGLSLNSAEMMKAYIIQQVDEKERDAVNRQWQENINQIKQASSYDSSGVVNTEDVVFISTWLRAKYATTMREGKRAAQDGDYEQLGDKFHTWVRDHALDKMGLGKSESYKRFVMTEMTKATEIFLQIKEYSKTLTPDYEEVFYNADRDLTYQTMLVLAAINSNDSKEVIKKKIQMTTKFVDDLASIRIFNFKKSSWNYNKNLLFRVMCEVRDKNCKEIGMVYVRALQLMDVTLEGIKKFGLNQFSVRYMRHILARFTSYVNVLMGNPSHFDEYVNRDQKGNTYDVEHILPDRFDDYENDFEDEEDFKKSRDSIGNLILLTRDKNRSYQAMKYQEKVKRYLGDNILAQALNQTAYKNNPQFTNNVVKRYKIKAFSEFKKESIDERATTYLQLASDIWNPKAIKDLAGGWTPAEETDFFKTTKAFKNPKKTEYVVNYADRSWKDALKYGFLSANISGSGLSLHKIQPGDLVFCYIKGSGFVGIGKCISSAVPMEDFKVDVNGIATPVAQAPWTSEKAKSQLDQNREIFIRIDWRKYVDSQEEGYKEKGLSAVRLVAYVPNNSTRQKIKEHFKYVDDKQD